MKHVLSALVIVYAFSLVAELGSYWWFFDLASHWRAHYVLAGILLVAVTAYCKYWKLALVAGIVAVVHLIPLAQYLNFFSYSPQVKAAQDGQVIRVAYVNTYWRQPTMDKVIPALKEVSADVLFLEEIQPEQYQTVKAALTEYPHSYHEPVAWAFDMAVFSKQPFEKVTAHYFVPNVPTLEASIEYGSRQVKFFGVHPFSPVSAEFAKGRDEMLMKLFGYINAREDTTIMGGDFNITQFSPIYREITKGSRLIDTQKLFRLENTWPTNMPESLGIPIDHVFVSRDVEVLERYKGPETGSDHWPLIVKVRL